MGLEQDGFQPPGQQGTECVPGAQPRQGAVPSDSKNQWKVRNGRPYVLRVTWLTCWTVEPKAGRYLCVFLPLPHPAHRRNSQLIKIDSGNGGLKPYAFTPNRDLFDSEVSVRANVSRERITLRSAWSNLPVHLLKDMFDLPIHGYRRLQRWST